MKAGDYVTLNTSNGEICYAEVVGETVEGLEVYFIEKGEDSVWSYSEEWHVVPKPSVVCHVKTAEYANVVLALNRLGFRPLTDCTFAHLDETSMVPVGDPKFDTIENDVVGIHPEMRDFIIPDEEGERFTFATADNDFVRETHKAVRDFNTWVPNEDGKKIKDFILSVEERVIDQENSRSRLGEGLSYNNPPN